MLLKNFDERGFVFFTNLGSRKAHDLATNPRCSLLFPWHGLQRQVRVEGVAELVDRDEVTAYFSTRPRGAQFGAWASPQSSVTTSSELEGRYTEAADQLPVERAGSRVLGRVRRPPAVRGVLAGPAEPDARPAALSA